MVDARIIVVIAVALLIGGIVVASGSLQPAGFTDGEIEEHLGWTGGIDYTGGRTTYATAWKPNQNSEDITVQGWGTSYESLPWSSWDFYRYKVYLEGVLIKSHPVGDDWISLAGIRITPGTIVFFESFTFTLPGPLFGRLKVVQEAKINGWWPSPDYEGSMGSDGAFLESGRGEIFLLESNPGPFEEGEDAPVYVSTGFSNGGQWLVRLRPPLTRPDLFPARDIKTLGDDKSQIVNIRIEEGWFIEGNWQDNLFIVELWNPLFPIGFETIFMVDDHAREPTKPVVSYILDGPTATITAVSTATFKNIEGFVVWAWYGTLTKPSNEDSQSWIRQGREYDMPTVSGDNYTVTFNIKAKNFDGLVVVEIRAYDIDGRTSPPSDKISLKVEGGSFEGGPKLTQPFIWSIIVSLLIAIGLIFGFIVAYYVWFTTGSIVMTLFAFLIIFGVFGIGAFIAGSVPSIATLLGLSIGGI